MAKVPRPKGVQMPDREESGARDPPMWNRKRGWGGEKPLDCRERGCP